MGIIRLSEYDPAKYGPYACVTLWMAFRGTPDTDWYGVQPHVQTMPVYCPRCGRALEDFYCHLGSRYGQVGNVTCDWCGGSLPVCDHDNIVDSIRVDKVEVSFRELYKFHWRYLRQVEENTGISLQELFSAKRGYPLAEAIALLKGALKLDPPRYAYITDRRFDRLPPEINAWLSLLDACGVGGLYLERGNADETGD